MRVTLAILLNLGLLAVVGPWLWRQWRWTGRGWWRLALGVGLGLRVAVGVARNWELKLDAKFMNSLAGLVTEQLWTDPVAGFWTLTQAVVVLRIKTDSGFELYDAVFQNTSNTWIMVKILALLNLGSMGVGWLNSLYMSVFAFVGCWCLVRSVREVLPRTPAGAGVVAFLLWPTVWFWATGISKEALLLGSGAWLTARVLTALYSQPVGAARSWWAPAQWWLGTAALALLHFHMRYFFALPLLGVLGAVALAHWLERAGWVRQRGMQVAVLLAVLAAGAWLAPKLSIAFSVNKFTNQVMRVYSHELAYSAGKPHFEYPNLRPTLESIAAHAPVAALNAVTRPWPGESWQAQYLALGFETLGLMVLFGLVLVALWRGRSGHLPFQLGLGLLVFCLILAVLMGLTTPNFGSLSRYRSGLLPFLVFLLLQNDYAAALLQRLGMRTIPKPDQGPAQRLAKPVA